MPQKVNALSGLKMCAVAAAENASCSVTAAGELYTWGRGDCGRLGHGDEADQLAPKRVEALQDEWVVAVSPATCHTIAVTRGGGVFGWGAADGLGLPEAATVVVVRPGEDDDEEDEEQVCIMSPHRYPQLSCVPRIGAV